MPAEASRFGRHLPAQHRYDGKPKEDGVSLSVEEESHAETAELDRLRIRARKACFEIAHEAFVKETEPNAIASESARLANRSCA